MRTEQKVGVLNWKRKITKLDASLEKLKEDLLQNKLVCGAAIHDQNINGLCLEHLAQSTKVCPCNTTTLPAQVSTVEYGKWREEFRPQFKGGVQYFDFKILLTTDSP